MTMDDIVPKPQLRELFGDALKFEEYGLADLSHIVKHKPHAMHGVAGSVWNRIVTNGAVAVDPMQLGAYFDRRDPKLHRAISKVIGQDVIRDIRWCRAWNGVQKKANFVMELLLVEVFPGEIHLGDVVFQHPDRPIAPANRKFTHQTHQGLGLLGTLVNNMCTYAQQQGLPQLTLTAADRDLVPLFQKHGFTIENSRSAIIGMQFGISIPMERAVQ